MLSKKKKIVILCSMIALLILTGVLNVVLNNTALGGKGDEQTGGDALQGNFFQTYRMDRQATRQESMGYLDEIIKSETDEEIIQQARDKRTAIVDLMNQELELETLIKALGYEDCIVTIGTSNINCIIKTSELTDESIVPIVYTLSTETNRPATGIKVIPVS